MNTTSKLDLRKRFLSSSRPLPEIEVEYGAGSWLYRRDGSRIFDGSSGLLCANVGHNSSKIAGRIAGQLSRFAYGGPAVIQPYNQVELVRRLTAAVGRPDDSVAFTTSGTTGVEVAIAIAKNAARTQSGEDRGDVLASNLSYHGNSAFTLAIAGNGGRRPRPQDSFGLAPGFAAPYPTAHTPPGESNHVCVASCADDVARAIDERGAENVAAVIIEPVNGTTGGAFVPPAGYLAQLGRICRARGVVVIHDEVLTGLWRAGRPLASQHWDDSSPDIVILSKGLGAGYTSVAAVLVAPHIANLLNSKAADPMPALGTMAATPLQAAICLGVIDELESIEPEAYERRVDTLTRGLLSLQGRRFVRDVRGIGFLHAVELESSCLWPFMAAAEKYGAFFYPFSYQGGDGFMVAPPVNSSDADIDHVLSVIDQGLTALA